MAEKSSKEEPKKAVGKASKIEVKASNKGSASYGAKDITVLEGLEPVRLRPGMYIGSTGTTGLHHLIWEIVDNSIDEVMAGYAKNITIELLPDNKVSVTDDGRGVPVDIHPQTKKSTLETIMTVLHAGGKFGGEGYKVSGGLHGVGASVVNALSTWVKVEVERDGGSFVQEYKRGVPVYKVKKVGASKRHGTKTTFSPDPEIFSDLEFNDKTILERLRQQAYLTKGVRISFFDRRKPVPNFYGFYFEGGVLSYVKFLSQKKNRLNEDIFYVEKEMEKLDIEAAFLYIDDTRVQEMSFANNIFTPEGGMHLTGFRSALTRSLNNFARTEGYLKEKEENLTADDVREGLVAVLSVKLRDPQFEGQTKSKLGNPEARTVTEAVINEGLKDFLEKHPQEAKSIIGKVILSAKARLAAKAARETVLRKGAFEGLTLPGKLADCTSKIAAESELFIVEGDSAGGTAKQGRNRHTQAILPLRGKPLNVERARLDKMLANAEVRALVIAIGTAIGEEFSIDKLRYHKIIIMTDADVDGAHIRTLLLTLFYRYFRPVVDGGFVYIAQPPLYRVQKGKKVEYAYSDEGLKRALGNSNITLYDPKTKKTLTQDQFNKLFDFVRSFSEYSSILENRGLSPKITDALLMFKITKSFKDEVEASEMANKLFKSYPGVTSYKVTRTSDGASVELETSDEAEEFKLTNDLIKSEEFQKLIDVYQKASDLSSDLIMIEGTKKIPVKDFKDLFDKMQSAGSVGANIQRYKGLGEMNAEQLWETTMNPEVRLMKQVKVEDAEKADKLFDTLMGDAVEPRKNFIQAHASTVQNLDI